MALIPGVNFRWVGTTEILGPTNTCTRCSNGADVQILLPEHSQHLLNANIQNFYCFAHFAAACVNIHFHEHLREVWL